MHPVTARFSLYIIAAFLLCGFLLSYHARGQDITGRKRRQVREAIEESKGRVLETELEEEDISQDLEIDYGGYFRFTFLNWDDGEDEHVLRLTDFRLWGNMVYKNTYQAYARMSWLWEDYNKGTQYFYEDENDTSFFRLDVGYLKADVTQALNVVDAGRLMMKGGRDYYRAGGGLTLDRRGDGGQMDYTLDNLTIKGYLMQTIVSEENLDRTHPRFGQDRRQFGGIDLEYEFARELTVFSFAVSNRYHNRQDFLPANYTGTGDQKFGHDSRYYGFGVRGDIGAGFNYMGEYVIERGKHYGRRGAESFTKESGDVEASALQLKGEYTFRTVKTQPRFHVHYVWGSGDSDVGNTLDTVGSNQTGTDYEAFTPFGYVNTGLSFYPQVSNLRMVSLGAAFNPLDEDKEVIQLEAGFAGFYYWRNKSQGGISDRFMDPGGSFLGRELDLYLIWRPFSDVSILTQYGVFWPERKPFRDHSNRFFFSVGTIIYF